MLQEYGPQPCVGCGETYPIMSETVSPPPTETPYQMVDYAAIGEPLCGACESVLFLRAQALYDLRSVTGFCSGTDLHELFRAVCTGEPSPSGHELVERSRLAEHVIGRRALELLAAPLDEALEGICAYIGA